MLAKQGWFRGFLGVFRLWFEGSTREWGNGDLVFRFLGLFYSGGCQNRFIGYVSTVWEK